MESKNNNVYFSEEHTKEAIATVFKKFFLLQDEARIQECRSLISALSQEFDGDSISEERFNELLLIVKRISYECPIKAISDEFYKLLAQYCSHRLSRVSLPEHEVSCFFANDALLRTFETPAELVSLDDELHVRRKEDASFDEYAYDTFHQTSMPLPDLVEHVFLSNGRLLHHERILQWFPNYLLFTHQFNALVMDQEQILPLKWRYYLAIMAVECYENEYF